MESLVMKSFSFL